MALDLQGLFVNPATLRDQRLEGVAQQRRQLAQMGGSMAGLLGQVAGGGSVLGEQMAEGIARGMGLETTAERDQKALNKVIKEVDTTNTDSLLRNANKLQQLRPDIANQMRERAVAITSATHKAEMDRIQQDKDNLFRARELGLKAETVDIRREELAQKEAEANKRHEREVAKLNFEKKKASDERGLDRAKYIKEMYKDFTAESVYNHLYKGGELVPKPKDYEPTAAEKQLIAAGLDPTSEEFQNKMLEIIDAKIAKDRGTGKNTNYTSQDANDFVVNKLNTDATLGSQIDATYGEGGRLVFANETRKLANDKGITLQQAMNELLGNSALADPFAGRDIVVNNLSP